MCGLSGRVNGAFTREGAPSAFRYPRAFAGFTRAWPSSGKNTPRAKVFSEFFPPQTLFLGL